MRSNHLLAAAALTSVIALAGCDKARPLPAPADPARGCLSCHGGEENSTAAPPFSLPRDAAGTIVASGNRYDHTANTTHIEVGAHTRHLARGVSCGACHVVPTTIGSPGHNTGQRATVTFKELAAAGNVIPSAWVPAVHTCTNYCHGASLNSGGTNHAPDWLGGTAAGACGTCHFAANVTPPARHPQGPNAGGVPGAFPDTTTCAVCHTETVNASTGDINVGGGKHLNGQLDGGGGHPAGWADPANHGPAASGGLQGCAVCHGTDFAGGTSGVSCNDCHATNGHPNWKTECTFCHGSPARAADATFPNVGSGTVVRANLAAPPVGSQGENAITAYAVGAHDAHVAGGPFGNPTPCSECHGPTLPADIAHANGTVVIGWGVAATHGGTTPAPAAGNLPRWSDTTGVVPSCTNFCHGATLAGGTHTSPKWNEGAAGASCGSCHAIPLPYTAAGGWHVPRSDCNACHPGYTSTSVNLADHIYVGAGPSGLTCHSCHGSTSNDAPPTDTAGGTSGSRVGAHQKHVATLTLRAGGFACTECHTDNAGNTRHANGSVNVLWGPVAAAGGYPVTPASGSYPPGSAFPACANYCHLPRADDTAAGLVRTSGWTATGNIVCGSCHGLPPVTASHPAGAAACSTCHDGYADAPTAASTATAVSLTNHINGLVDVKAMSCTACHGTTGRTSVAGADPLQPVAPPVAATGAAAVGAHLAHVNQADGAAPGPLSSPFRCVNCHNGLVPVLAPHAYPANPVAWGNVAVAAGAVPSAYVQATQTCSNTYCHGQFGGGRPGNSVTWGTAGKLACNACHGQSTPLPAAQPTYPHPQNTTCASCHPGYTSSTVATATHVDGFLSRSALGCTACHGDRADTAVTLTTNTLKAAPGASGTTATSADTTGATATSSPGVGAHRAHLVGTSFRAALACTDCHALPASNSDTAHATGVGTGGARATVTWSGLASGNVFETKVPAFSRPTCSNVYCHDPRSDDTAATNPAPSWIAPGSVTCGSCHGLPPATATHPAGTACGDCHPGYGPGTVNPALHLNGALDGGGESSGGLACAGCHASVAAMMTTAGNSKHSLVGFVDTASDAGGAWGAATTLSSILPANRSCVNMCHSDHPHSLTSPVTATHENNLVADPSSTATRAAGTSTSVTRARTDFDPAANTGMCTKCHAKPVVAGGITVSDATFGASAHDFTTSASPALTWSFALHDGSLFLRNCTKCHASAVEGTTPAAGGTGLTAVHGQANPNLLAGTSRPAGTAAGFVCYNCHGSTASPAAGAQGNRSTKNIQAQIAKTRNHPANADAVHDTAIELAGAAFGNTLGVTGRHSSCLDCHDTHEAMAGTHAVTTNLAGPPLQGAWGAQLSSNPAFWTAPAAGSFTKKTLTAGTDLEATLCFKCHSSYYGALPTSPSGGYTETDTAREFNPANAGSWYTAGTANAWSNGETAGGFHPVLATSANNLGAVKQTNLVTTSLAWRTTGARNLMTCTDCHESDTTTDPSGPHGSTANFILRGPNTTWTQAVVLGSQIPAGTFCLNCHQNTFTNSRFTGHSRGDHAISCWNCHARIPHGGPRPGMLVAGAGASANVGGVIGGWDQAAPYWAGTGSDRLYLVSYPTTNTANWSQGNCGCNGTGH